MVPLAITREYKSTVGRPKDEDGDPGARDARRFYIQTLFWLTVGQHNDIGIWDRRCRATMVQ